MVLTMVVVVPGALVLIIVACVIRFAPVRGKLLIGSVLVASMEFSLLELLLLAKLLFSVSALSHVFRDLVVGVGMM